ncbi:YgiQ family radical SAM protein [Geoalkalibacter halelectricus]|uniref:YgiQ family radical SAM protein n=1 Tax=Geoalkalibacter halelectricus TaxID=2847045 RepID=A0ABY5ZNI3_9BACT|nr:YgiQ family radical SAM protein [Geoalkalibacter halelectricus]MDO3377586.1 YgiQ family radical SAM protein [Geoalkalibacter halelectricus]UWZ80656.1 YgiQ family radical SAM protein [Geoalkalibacter halelectricus]
MTPAWLPTTRAEMVERGWDELDVLFVSGDAYVDHPAFGVPLLARLLESEGYRVGIIAQPKWKNPAALRVMGRPRLFAAVSAGAMDSLVNRYTAAKKVRNDDAYTPGGQAGARPDRAVIAYTAALKGAFKGLPVVIGGIEASLRRLAHYDFWDDRVRRSVLVDSKADLLVFGMGEAPLLEIARRAAAGEAPREMQDIRGTAVMVPQPEPEALELPSFEKIAQDSASYNEAFRLAAEQANPWSGRPLVQQHATRWVRVNPPTHPLGETELDRLYALPFTRLPHPGYKEKIPAYEQIKFSITAHRGCAGGCAFCAITHHQGKFIQSRSPKSVLAEITELTNHPEFRGTLSDVGGPTANMYGMFCGDEAARRACRRESCLHPRICRHLATGGARAARLLESIRALTGVKHVFVASGVRYDLLDHQQEYFEALLAHHVGGLLKIAPESVVPEVTAIMRKPGPEPLEKFLRYYREACRDSGKRQGVVPYLIAGHPGCTLTHMVDTALFLKRHNLRVEQVQEFTPTPGTLATCIWHTGRDPFSGAAVHAPKDPRERRLQKALLLYHLPENRGDVVAALRACGREDQERELLGNVRAARARRGRQ